MRTASTLTLLSLLLSMPALGGPPIVAFEEKTILVKDVTPGGRVACYGVGREFVQIRPEIVRCGREAVDDDRDGAVAIELPRPVPRRSLWVCADVATGTLAVASPITDSPEQTPFSGSGVDLKGPLGSFAAEGAQKDLFLLRPGDGAWLALAGDGGTSDGDRRTDGRVLASTEAFRGIGAARGALASLHAGATVVAIDPLSLEFSIVPVGRK